MTCLTAGCNSTRIRKGCGRRMCKAHCREAGSIGICTDPAHKVSQPTMTAAVAPPTSSFPVNAGPLLLPLSMQQKPVEPNHFESQRQLPVPPIASSSHRTGPTFSSHMTELYTAQMAREEQMREDRCQIEATRLESKRKVQQTVFVYTWTEVCFVSTDLIGHLLITF